MSATNETSQLSTLPSSSVVVIDKPNQLVTINAAAQLPIKLTPLNFPSWRCQFQSMLLGYDLLGYINGSIQCPSALVPQPSSTTTPPEMISNLAYVHWM